MNDTSNTLIIKQLRPAVLGDFHEQPFLTDFVGLVNYVRRRLIHAAKLLIVSTLAACEMLRARSAAQPWGGWVGANNTLIIKQLRPAVLGDLPPLRTDFVGLVNYVRRRWIHAVKLLIVNTLAIYEVPNTRFAARRGGRVGANNTLIIKQLRPAVLGDFPVPPAHFLTDFVGFVNCVRRKLIRAAKLLIVNTLARCEVPSAGAVIRRGVGERHK